MNVNPIIFFVHHLPLLLTTDTSSPRFASLSFTYFSFNANLPRLCLFSIFSTYSSSKELHLNVKISFFSLYRTKMCTLHMQLNYDYCYISRSLQLIVCFCRLFLFKSMKNYEKPHTQFKERN